jgi:COP9 signalosome complex subunit 8
MGNGPPTPPLTSPTELLDNARENTPAPETTVGTPALPQTQSRSPKQDVYRLAFPTFANLAARESFGELIQTAEEFDLNSDGDHHQSRLLLTAPLVLAYLIVDELPPAHYALTRLPDNLASLPLSQALLLLLSSALERKHARVYSRAEHLFNMVRQPEFLDTKLASVIADMVTTFVESFRQRTFVLLSKAYTLLPLSLARTYLGLPADQLLAVAEKNQWSYEASTQILTPLAVISDTYVTGTSGPSSLVTFRLVANSVAKLEI